MRGQVLTCPPTADPPRLTCGESCRFATLGSPCRSSQWSPRSALAPSLILPGLVAFTVLALTGAAVNFEHRSGIGALSLGPHRTASLLAHVRARNLASLSRRRCHESGRGPRTTSPFRVLPGPTSARWHRSGSRATDTDVSSAQTLLGPGGVRVALTSSVRSGRSSRAPTMKKSAPTKVPRFDNSALRSWPVAGLT